jgi:hypothetical protein
MLDAELSAQHLAGLVGVDVKSVARWITEDRVPHPVTRVRVARALNQQDTYLWPSILGLDDERHHGDTELDRIWPMRSAVSTEVWHSLFNQAARQLDILVYAGAFLIESLDFADILKVRSSVGTQVRVLIGDPDSDAVRLRAVEEEACWLPERCRTTQRDLLEVRCAPTVAVKLHGTTLYASLFRFDDAMMVNTHVYGAPGYESPVQRIRRRSTGGMFDHYAASFDRVWAASKVAISK